jgi:hypothetical protein
MNKFLFAMLMLLMQPNAVRAADEDGSGEDDDFDMVNLGAIIFSLLLFAFVGGSCVMGTLRSRS